MSISNRQRASSHTKVGFGHVLLKGISMTKSFRTRAAATLAMAVVLAAVGPAQAADPPKDVTRPRARTVTTGCASVTIIGARGSGQFEGYLAWGQQSGFGPEVHGAALDAVSRLSAKQTVRYDRLIYPAAGEMSDLFSPTRSAAYNQSVKAGVARVKVQVEYFVRNCPKTKIVLIGYSQGATVIQYGAAALAPSVARHVSVIALIANPSRHSLEVTMQHFSTGNPGIGPNVASGNGIKGPGPHLGVFLGQGAEFCNNGDPVCNSKPSWFWKVPQRWSAHTTQYEGAAARAWIGGWVAGRLNKAGIR